jgi:hypothetical protein
MTSHVIDHMPRYDGSTPRTLTMSDANTIA